MMLFAVRVTKLRLGVVEQGCAKALEPTSVSRAIKKRIRIRYKNRVKTSKNAFWTAKLGFH